MIQLYFIFLVSKITMDGDCSHEVKRHLAPWKESYDKLSTLKSRDITLPMKICIVKTMVFQLSCMDMRAGPLRKANAKEQMLLNYGVGEDSRESLGL